MVTATNTNVAYTNDTNDTIGTLPRRNRVVEAPQITCFQWANNTLMARREGETRFVNHLGWFIEKGKSESIDAVCASIAIPSITIRFRRVAGDTKPSETECWDFGQDVWVYPLTTGVRKTTVSAARHKRELGMTIAAGIGTSWPKGDGEKSKTAVPVLVKPLVDVGCMEPLELPTRSNMGDILLAVLADHTSRVCDAVEALPKVAASGMQILPWDLALPLGEGPEVTWGKDLGVSTLTVFASKHPENITEEYMKSIAAPKTVRMAALSLWPGIQEWARAFAANDEQADEWSPDGGLSGPAIATPVNGTRAVSPAPASRQLASPPQTRSQGTPVTASASAAPVPTAATTAPTPQTETDIATTIPPQGYGDVNDVKLMEAITCRLASDVDAVARMPKAAADLAREEMEALLPWLVRRYKKSAAQA